MIILSVSQVIQESFSAVNIVPTTMLCLAVVYWFTVILGALDMGFLDFDLDVDYEADVDIQVDVDAEVSADVDGGAEPSMFIKLLSFFNLGKVPFMVVFTAVAIPMWFIATTTNSWLGIHHLGIALLLTIPYLFVSLLLSKVVTQPLAKLFHKMEKDEVHDTDLIGKICRVKYGINDERTSQAEVDYDGRSYLINAKATSNKSLARGETGLLIDYIKEDDYYLVEPYANPT